MRSETFLKASANVLAEVEDAPVGDKVDDVQPFLATAQDAGVGEGLEMAGDVRLGQGGGLNQLRDIPLLPLEGAQKFQPAPFAENAEARGDKFQDLVRHLNGFSFTWHTTKLLLAQNLYAHIVILSIARSARPSRERHVMTIENGIRVLAGTMVLTSLALAHWVDPRWLLLAAFVGVNLIQSAFTGFCPATIILKKCGVGKGDRSCCG